MRAWQEDRVASATHGALVRYARAIACLPPFPQPTHAFSTETVTRDRTPLSLVSTRNELAGRPRTILKLVTTNKTPGEVLPTPSDVWIALLPFRGLVPGDAAAGRRDLIQKRRTFVSLLARLTVTGTARFRWNTTTMYCGESSGSMDARSTFWVSLLRALDPSSDRGDVTRQLIATFTELSPQFLLCINDEVTSTDFLDLLDEFLHGSDAAVEDESILAEITSSRPVTVSVGLSFAEEEITYAVLSKLLAILDRNSQLCNPQGVHFRVSTVRFGRNCAIQAKAFELFGQHASLSAVVNLRLGCLTNIPQASLRVGLLGVFQQQRALSRVRIASQDQIPAVASALRVGNTCIRELDIMYQPTSENAAWLAYALFHVDSKATITSLRLRPPSQSDATPKYLETFERVLRVCAPYQELMSFESSGITRPHGCEQEHKFVKLHENPPVKSEPLSSGRTLFNVAYQGEEFEVIAVVRNWINWIAVIVAGLGVGWVRSSSIESERIMMSQLHNDDPNVPTNRNITTLKWDGTAARPSHRDTATESPGKLLTVIGEPLKSLHLPSVVKTTEQLAKLLACCPNLTELNISSHQLASIAPLRDAYATGCCKISSLSIARGDVGLRQGQLAIEMTEILRGPSGKTLEQLVVPALYPRFMDRSPEHLQASQDLVRLAATCPRLQYIQFPAFAHFRGQVSDPQVDFSSNPYFYSPPPMPRKLAFLSCLSDHDGTSARGRLDARVLSLILRMSAQSIPRRAILHATFPF